MFAVFLWVDVRFLPDFYAFFEFRRLVTDDSIYDPDRGPGSRYFPLSLVTATTVPCVEAVGCDY